jgi:hypothetical protein
MRFHLGGRPRAEVLVTRVFRLDSGWLPQAVVSGEPGGAAVHAVLTGMPSDASDFWVKTASHDHAFIDRTTTRIEDSLTAHGYDVNSEVDYVKLADEIASYSTVTTTLAVVGLLVVAIGMAGLAVAGWLIGVPVGYLLERFLVWMIQEVADVNLTLAFPRLVAQGPPGRGHPSLTFSLVAAALSGCERSWGIDPGGCPGWHGVLPRRDAAGGHRAARGQARPG